MHHRHDSNSDDCHILSDIFLVSYLLVWKEVGVLSLEFKPLVGNNEFFRPKPKIFVKALRFIEKEEPVIPRDK